MSVVPSTHYDKQKETAARKATSTSSSSRLMKHKVVLVAGDSRKARNV